MDEKRGRLVGVPDLALAPFNLNEAELSWVQQTLRGMSLEEKTGQLFVLLVDPANADRAYRAVEGMKPGGFMFRPGPASEIQEHHRRLQECSPVPLLLAANLERGGNGIAIEGTDFATPLQVAATDDPEAAYQLGLVSGREGRAVGCNWTFSPTVDIDLEPRNPITNTRTYGSDPRRVARMAERFIAGVHDAGLAVTLKHWPGDGVDFRDQHLVTSVNDLDRETWQDTYGHVYSHLIETGADAVMTAHIALTFAKSGGRYEGRMLPASLDRSVTTDLLRDQFGFNGLIVSDATPMLGFMAAMPRAEAVPAAIAAGCDVFLFTHNADEDLEYMRKGIEDGVVSESRLDEAVLRILGLKASLALHDTDHQTSRISEAALRNVGAEQHLAWSEAVASRAIRLVHDIQGNLPLTPSDHPRLLIHGVADSRGGRSEHLLPLLESLRVELEQVGFAVTNYRDSGLLDPSSLGALGYPLKEFRAQFDAAIFVLSFPTRSNQVAIRVEWEEPLTLDAPRFVREIPTIFVSLDNPYHLSDLPSPGTYINCFGGTPSVVRPLVEKLTGHSPFTGGSPVDADPW